MHINNKCGWITEFAVATSVLEVKTGLKRRTIERARNELKQKGRINWKSRKGNQSAVYTIISFVRKYDAQSVAQYDVQHDAQSVAQPVAINKLNKSKLNNNNQHHQANNMEDNGISKVVKIFESNIHPITPMEGEIISDWIDKLEADVIIEAIREAVKNNKRSIKYIEKILINWHSNNLTTKDAVVSYLRDYADSKRNKYKGGGIVGSSGQGDRFNDKNDKTDQYSEVKTLKLGKR